MTDMRAWADLLERYGRHGDTLLAHIGPAEAKLLKKRGGSGTINPVTGLPEFWGDSDNDGTDSDGGLSGGTGSNGPQGGNDVGSDTGLGGDTSNDGGALGGGIGPGGFFSAGEDLSQESEFGERAGGVNWSQYQRPDLKAPETFGRLMQEMRKPSIPTSRTATPTAYDPGFLTPAVGLIGGPMLAGLMAIGSAMGRAQTPEQQAASMAENQARGAMNSGGNTPDMVFQREPGPGATAGMGVQAPQQQQPTTPIAQPPPRLTPESWDEQGFLERNPEVRAAVSSGSWPSGYAFDQAYRNNAGVPYEQAMTTSRPEDYVNELLALRPGAVMPYRGR